jgi:hypothetical protein
MRRKVLVLVGAVGGILAGSAVYRRSFARRPEHVDVYYADGSMISYTDASSEGGSLLPVARDAIAAVHS